MPARQRLRSYQVTANPIGVDREKRVIHGYIIAEVGEFKSGRGQFNLQSLEEIVLLINAQPDGVKCRYGHPGPSCVEALDSFVGWVKNARLDGNCVRGDLHLSEVVFLTPASGGASRGEYLLARAEKEPNSFGSSLELEVEMLPQSSGPPVWIPTAILCSDIVDDGDAVHTGFLSSGQVDITVAIDQAFPRATREEMKAFFAEYLLTRYGASPEAIAEAQELRRLYRNRKQVAGSRKK